MTVNTKNAPAATVTFSKAQIAGMAGCRTAAFNSGISRGALISAISSALGRTPLPALYRAAVREVQIGLMSAALVRKGDNRPEAELAEHCRERLANYAGFGSKGKVKPSQKGRRTKREEEAYGSARVQITALMKAANVTVPGGGTAKDSSQLRQPQQGSNASDNVVDIFAPLVRRFSKPAPMIAHCDRLVAALLGTVNRNAKITPNELKTAIQSLQEVTARLNA